MFFFLVIRYITLPVVFKIDRTNFRLKKLLYHKNGKIIFKKLFLYITCK